MSQTDFFGDLGRVMLVWQNRWVVGPREDGESTSSDLDLAGGKFLVVPAHPSLDVPNDLNDILASKRARRLHDICVAVFLVEDHLRESRPVPNIDEDESLALIAEGIDPATD
jgi:hypothetical protein